MFKNLPFRHRLRAATHGVIFAWKTEQSFRTQTWAGLGALILLGVFRPDPVWWSLFALSVGAVLSLELVNTALEHVLDRLHPGEHPMIGLAKDCAAGAVLVASFVSLLILGCFLAHILAHR